MILMKKGEMFYYSEFYLQTDIGKLKITIKSVKDNLLKNILTIDFYLLIDKTKEKDIFNKSAFLRIDERYKINTLVMNKEQKQYIRKYLTLDILGDLIAYTSGL